MVSDDPTATASAGMAPDTTSATSATDDEAARRADFDRYFAMRTHFGNLALSPDGREVAYIVNTSGQFNIWRQPVTGGWPSQVTTFERESVRGIIWAPSGEIIGMADADGNEQYQIFAIPATGGAVRYFTHQPDVQYHVQYQMSEDGLSPDGHYLAFVGNDREPTDADVLLCDITTGETHRALANGRTNAPGNWSPDGRYFTVIDDRANTDQHLWLIDTETGEAREALPHEDGVILLPGPWLPDSSGLYVLLNRGREYTGVACYDLASGELRWALAPEWDVEHLALSEDGRRMIWAQNESGASQLYVRDGDETALRVVGLPRGVIEAMDLSADGKTLALRINAATAPAEIYVVTLGEVSARETPLLRRLTYGMLGGLAPDELIAPELVSYPTFDGREIPAWLYRPQGLSEHHQGALVISIHGGPEYQERVEYHAFYQYLLKRGIAVLAPNIRGSTGYGISYQKLIHRDWGGAELKDIEAAAQYAQSLPWVAAHRIGVYGGSFGGFATLSAVSRLPDYWAAAVDIVGPSNLLTFARSVPPTWRRMMADWVGDPDADAELLSERSPI
ncbi:MAG TPA: prolyl oligopeptidase family serine peptidase, partial [Ktedonobacterales bacterium]|nr:prolyl oligopeptidase family serine peptidase [Ktedonobacterales bacterium]